jgi:hypothetical protein
MANTLLTVDQITKEALMILHQKINFLGSIYRAYDDSFAQSGAKIGDSLRIRLPNRYVVGSGADVSATNADTTETQVTLQVNNQKHVRLDFTDQDLALNVENFSTRFIEPAMAQLAATIEADVISNVYKDVYQQVSNVGSAVRFKEEILNSRKILTDSLAPQGDRYVCLDTQANVDLVDSLKGLFNDPSQISKQYRDGYIGRTAGFDFMENTLLPRHVTGTNAGTGYLVNGASQTGSSLTVDTGTGTLVKGDIFTIAGVFRVHPETREATNTLQQFTVTSNYAGGSGSIAISPPITISGSQKTVNASPADNAAITKIGTSAQAHNISLAYHKQAFTFATADLEVPKGTDMASRQTYDGISMRLIRDFQSTAGSFLTRIDVLYGYKTIRPELACRIAAN